MRNLRRMQRGEDGQIVVLTAFLLVILLGFSALAIDVGFWLHTRTKLQADADAMALAGAQELATSTSQADAIAREWGTKNGVAGSEVVSVTFSGSSCKQMPPSSPYVTVKLKRNQPTFLAKGRRHRQRRYRGLQHRRASSKGPGLRPLRPRSLRFRRPSGHQQRQRKRDRRLHSGQLQLQQRRRPLQQRQHLRHGRLRPRRLHQEQQRHVHTELHGRCPHRA